MTPGREWNFVDTVEAVAQASPWMGGPAAAEAFIARGEPRAGAPPRDVALWFAGSMFPHFGPANDPSGRVAAFHAVFGTHTMRTVRGVAGPGGETADWDGLGRVVLANTMHESQKWKAFPFETWAVRSVVCLDPMGWAGGWAARYIALLALGCVPLNSRPSAVALPLDGHPAVDWSAFTLPWPSPHGANFSASLQTVLRSVLPSTTDAADRANDAAAAAGGGGSGATSAPAEAAAAGAAAAAARLSALRAAGRQVYTRFLWTSVNPVAGEMARIIRMDGGQADGGEEEAPPDAWATLLDILGWRADGWASGG
jgi:hypothetical protein